MNPTSPKQTLEEILEFFGYDIVNNPEMSRIELKRSPIAAIQSLIEEAIGDDQEHSSYCDSMEPQLGYCPCTAGKRNDLRAGIRANLRQRGLVG